MRLSIIIILVFILSSKIHAQFFENLFVIDSSKNLNAGDLHLNIDNSTFFKNNEYFGKTVEGYTLPGFWFQPKLSYLISAKTEMSVGVHLLKFFGKNEFYKIEPYFKVQHNITDNLSLTLGSLNTKYAHFLPSPVYDPERFYFHQIENGLQFQYYSAKIISDTWLSWDQFTFYGDSIQEQLTAGSSNKIELLEMESINIKMPVFILFTHLGGQINRPKKPIETLMNLGSGIELKLKMNRMLQSLLFEPQFIYYKKSSGAATRQFKTGWAMYPSITLFTKSIYFKTSWWYGNSFIGPRGEAIYQHVSTDQTYFVKERSLIIPKVGYFKSLSQGFHLNAGFEGFYDPAQKLFDYNFYVHFNFSGSWLIKNFNEP